MKKFTLFAVLLALPVLFLACGNGEVPAEDNVPETEIEDTAIEATFINGLEDYEITEIWVDPSDGAWSVNLIDEPLLPGEEFTVTLEDAGSYDLWITDEDGDTYTRYGIEINERGYEWEVVLDDGDWNVPEVDVTIINNLGDWTIWYVYGSPSIEDGWGEDQLGSELLAPEELVSFTVMANDYYDFKCIDEDDDEYVLEDVWVGEDGFEWNVVLDDMTVITDGIDVPVSIYNALGDYDIDEIWIDPSDGAWSVNLIDEPLLPGEEFSMTFESGSYDLWITDEDGDTYTRYGVIVDENGYDWEVELSDMD